MTETLRLVESSPDPLSDRQLLEQLREGSEWALDELVRRKTAPLLQAVRRILGDLEEARDVVQVAFLRVWENRRAYDARWSPNTWIYRIATNLAIDQLRSRRSRERQHEPYRAHLRQVKGGRGAANGEALASREVEEIFAVLAAELPEKQRAAFILREVEGLPSPEVARILGCRMSTVRNHVFNARKTLQRELRARYPEYAHGGAGDGS